MKIEAPHSRPFQESVRRQMRSYREGLYPNPPDHPNLMETVRLSLLEAGLKKVQIGANDDSTHIKTDEWNVEVQHRKNTRRITLVSYRIPGSIEINNHPFFFPGDVLDIKAMIASGEINDKHFNRIRELIGYRTTKIPPRQKGEDELSPTILALGELHFRREEAKITQI